MDEIKPLIHSQGIEFVGCFKSDGVPVPTNVVNEKWYQRFKANGNTQASDNKDGSVDMDSTDADSSDASVAQTDNTAQSAIVQSETAQSDTSTASQVRYCSTIVGQSCYLIVLSFRMRRSLLIVMLFVWRESRKAQRIRRRRRSDQKRPNNKFWSESRSASKRLNK